jgi:hypothetical protein
MRLIDFDPSWTAIKGRHGMGLAFLCPCCPKERQQHFHVPFANPLDGGAPYPDEDCKTTDDKIFRWQRSGDTFETLTLTPSINCMIKFKALPACPELGLASKPAHTEQHWHGFITKGVIT